MPEVLAILLGVVVAGAFILAPLRGRASAVDRSADLDAAQVRYRAALEALRDVEADRRAGSLDDTAYAAEIADAERRAADARAALSAAEPAPMTARGGGRRAAVAAGGVIAAVLVIGVAIPATGLANGTVENAALAQARQAEAARQADIQALVERVAEDPQDVEALSDLADAYLAGSTQDDLVRAAVTLRLLIGLEPERPDAYERIIAAYLRAGDYVNGRAALDAYAELAAADPVELAFFEGLIALRGDGDPSAAQAAFDRFLELAPDDGRAGMVRSLRDEAASGD